MNLDVFRRLNDGGDWKEICNEIDERILAIDKRLRSCTGAELIALQEKIKAYEELKILPDQVLEREE